MIPHDSFLVPSQQLNTQYKSFSAAVQSHTNSDINKGLIPTSQIQEFINN
jgi:hypothetical protein